MSESDTIDQAIERFIARWGGGKSHGGNETANLQLFIIELCELLDLPRPDPAGSNRDDNAYVFERKLTEHFANGGQTTREIDCYRRGCFVLEGKDTGKQTGSGGWDTAIVKAHQQSENYVRCLPPSEGRPPFIVIVDVGRSFTLYAEFSCSGGHYVAFPDSRRHTIPLEGLRDPEIRAQLRTLWLDPHRLDPTRYAGRITRKIADQLARLAKSLEETGHEAEAVAGFLMRCLFTMFSEDVGLLPERSFTRLAVCRADNLRHAAGAGARCARAAQAGGALYAARLCRAAGVADGDRAVARGVGGGAGGGASLCAETQAQGGGGRDSGVPSAVVSDAGTRSGLRQREFSLCDAGAHEAAG